MTTVQTVPIDRIRVINSRGRSKAKFREIVENISRVGLKKPITVSPRDGAGGFDLVCGEGRLEAYRACGATEIPAIVIDIPVEERLLRSLVENLTRRTPSGLEMARDVVALKERGHSSPEIAALIGVSDSYVANLIRLAEKGEERLIAAVERGEIPITTAVDIASADDATLQRNLQEAYESGKLRGKSLLKVRRLLDQRRARGKALRGPDSRRSRTTSTDDLVRTLRKETQKQALLVKKARLCEQQLRFVLAALRDLMKNDHFVSILRAEKLDALPKYLEEHLRR